MKNLADYCFKVLKNGGRYVIFCSWTQSVVWAKLLKAAGLQVQPIPLIITHQKDGN